MTDIAELIGTVRRFGLVGPMYEVVAGVDVAGSSGGQVRIRLVESGEETDYPAEASRLDPIVS